MQNRYYLKKMLLLLKKTGYNIVVLKEREREREIVTETSLKQLLYYFFEKQINKFFI